MRQQPRVGAERGRWELVRALGAVCDTPEAAVSAARALDLGELERPAHTNVFIMNAPPYAAIHLGVEGMLGGEGADRVAEFWRALGLVPPSEPDHLATLLALYAHLGEAGEDTRRSETSSALARMRHALLWEHLWSWAPGYSDAVIDLAEPVLSAWAELLLDVLAAEMAEGIGTIGQLLPAALRDAPAPLIDTDEFSMVLNGLIAPVRSGFVITRASLAKATGEVGVGHRIGERRFTLRAMFEQDAGGTLRWLVTEAKRWQKRRLSVALNRFPDRANLWWATRCGQTAQALSEIEGAQAATERRSVPASLTCAVAKL